LLWHGQAARRHTRQEAAGAISEPPTESDLPRIAALIAAEIYAALERLNADEELLAVIGSWRDTLDDTEVLRLLRDHNAGRPTLYRS
jgi:hypothetical protein